MKARITGKIVETKEKEKEYSDIDLLRDLLETGLIDENTIINQYPSSVKNVINHETIKDNKNL